MIIAFSTSSPWASVAILPEGGDRPLWQGRREAPRAASGACLELLRRGLKETGATLDRITLFVADLGPGSFTGVRVGVTLAKALAYAGRVPVAGADAFDLIDPSRTVVVPNKRGEWFVRCTGCRPERVRALPQEPYVGYGPGIGAPAFPDAAGFRSLIAALERVSPEELVPVYLVDPSISLPKKPYGGLRDR